MVLKNEFIGVCVAILFLLFGCKSKPSFANASKEEIVAHYAKEFIADHMIHSVSIVVYDQGKESIFHYGTDSLNYGGVPTDSTLYELASVTKTFTGTLVAKAVLDGKIGLDDAISKYLPERYPNLKYKEQILTIRDLITHTSGFPNLLPNVQSKSEFWKALHQIKIDVRPGTEFNYSNTAPEVTAYILEQVYNTPYRELVHKFILAPNEMVHTKFELQENEKRYLIQGFNAKKEPQEHFKNKLWGGSSGLHANTKDLMRYIKYHLDEKNVEAQESHKTFFKTSHGFDIGYHWNILTIDNEVCYRHHGGIWGMQNWLMLFPESDFGIAVLSNASFQGGLLSRGIDDKLEDLALNIKTALTN